MFFAKNTHHDYDNSTTNTMSQPGSTQPSHRRAQTNDEGENEASAIIIGEELEDELPDEYESGLQKTLSHEKKEATSRGYRNRIKNMISYWKTTDHCKAYYEQGVRQNTQEEMSRPLMWFFKGKYKEDLKYSGLNANFVLDFLNNQKILKRGENKGKFRSFDDMRKYRDAILDGAEIRREKVPKKSEQKITLY